MKKSQAIEILEDILKEWDGCMLNKKACRKILSKIEKRIGMLPPANEKFLLANSKADPSFFAYFSPHFWDKRGQK